MVITLINCNSKLRAQGVDVDSFGWQESFSSMLNACCSFLSWTYRYDADSLDIQCDTGTIIPDSIADFGEVVPNDNPMG